IDPDRHAREPRTEHPEQAALRCVRVDDGGPGATERSAYLPEGHEVAQRRDAARHIDPIRGHAIATGEYRDMLAGRGDHRGGEAPFGHEPHLAGNEMQREWRVDDVDQHDRSV